MTLHDRIMAKIETVDCSSADLAIEDIAFNAGIKQAAQLAKEADELMAEMAEAITKYATARTMIGARQAQSELLKVYGKIKERNNEQ